MIPVLYIAGWFEQIDAAESLGFDSLWVTEHHFRHFGGMMPSPAIILAAAAQRTKRMARRRRVNFTHAQSAAYRRRICHGRSAFIRETEFRRGTRDAPTEYTVFGYDWNNAQKRLPEALDIVIRAWSGAEFEWQSEHYRFPKLRVFPQPLQKPHRPIYVTAIAIRKALT